MCVSFKSTNLSRCYPAMIDTLSDGRSLSLHRTLVTCIYYSFFVIDVFLSSKYRLTHSQLFDMSSNYNNIIQ